jgi:hypothetical protein
LATRTVSAKNLLQDEHAGELQENREGSAGTLQKVKQLHLTPFSPKTAVFLYSIS